MLDAQVADHKAVLAKFDIAMAEATAVKRIVFDYAKANWAEMSRAFGNFDWTPMDALDVDSAERFFHRLTFAILRHHVRERELCERKSTHPWLNERCVEAIRAKNASAGPEAFAARTNECNAIIFAKFTQHIVRMRDKLVKEKHCSKC